MVEDRKTPKREKKVVPTLNVLKVKEISSILMVSRKIWIENFQIVDFK